MWAGGCKESVFIKEAPSPPPSPWFLAYCIPLGHWCYPTQGHPSGKAGNPETPVPQLRPRSEAGKPANDTQRVQAAVYYCDLEQGWSRQPEAQTRGPDRQGSGMWGWSSSRERGKS